jgi:hypothetical protein
MTEQKPPWVGDQVHDADPLADEGDLLPPDQATGWP